MLQEKLKSMPSILWLILFGLIDCLFSGNAKCGEHWVYFGTFAGQGSQGIYVSRFDNTTGKTGQPELAAEVESPSFLAFHPGHRFLYSVSEKKNPAGKTVGLLCAFSIEPSTGKLTLLNRVSSHGAGPCYVSFDASGRNALVANYNSGSVAVCPILTDGYLAEASDSVQYHGSSVNPQRQEGPHAHSINLSPDNRFVLAADLGQDKIFVYRFDSENGKLLPNNPSFVALKPGAGPRHFAFHPNGRFLFSLNELHSTVTVFAFNDSTGETSEIETLSTLPADFTGFNTTSEVLVHPTGKFIYCANRGHNSLTVFSIDEKTGKLTLVGRESTQGKTPRNFGIEPGGKFLLAANQNSNNVVVFKINPETGGLETTHQQVTVPSPVCVKFLPLNVSAQ